MRRWVAAAVPPPSPGPADQRSIFHDRGLGGVPPPLRGHQDTPKCDLTPERTAPLGQACPLATQALRYLSYNKESQHQAVLDEKKAPCPAKRLSTQPLPFRCAGGLRVGVGVGCRGGGGAVPAGGSGPGRGRYSNSAMCYLKLQQWVKAKDACDKLLAIDKDNVKVWFRVASPAHPFFFGLFCC